MNTIKGKFAEAIIYTDDVEDYALAQIKMLCDNEVSKNSKIRIMPDVHVGKVCTIGLTMTINDKVIPNLIGIDIGCGMTLARIKGKKVELQKLDKAIKENIPAGFDIRKKPHRLAEEFDFSQLHCERHIQKNKAMLSLGTLGGGNHFIELDKDDEGNIYIVIHTGSRHLGKEVTEHYLKAGQNALNKRGISVPYELTYLEGDLMKSYIDDLKTVQAFAELNRNIILDVILKEMKWKTEEEYSSIHNYIDTSNETVEILNSYVLRKGAISAKKDERVIIPINMRDGIILGTGLGNIDWNLSAPHGSGRIAKREDIKNSFTLSEFKKEMKGIYSTCVCKETLDEAPFAYRSVEYIKERISDTVKIDRIIKPIYSFKAK